MGFYFRSREILHNSVKQHAIFPLFSWPWFTPLNEAEIPKFNSINVKFYNVLSCVNFNLCCLEHEEYSKVSMILNRILDHKTSLINQPRE